MNRSLGDALRKQDTTEFYRMANEEMKSRTLILSGLNLATQGITTVEEVMHIAGEILTMGK